MHLRNHVCVFLNRKQEAAVLKAVEEVHRTVRCTCHCLKRGEQPRLIMIAG